MPGEVQNNELKLRGVGAVLRGLISDLPPNPIVENPKTP